MEKKFTICVDSDGCVMDTMDIKHEQYFGPLAADVFEISKRDEFLQEWNRVNLFSGTRGINRFDALVRLLDYAKDELGEDLIDISVLEEWRDTSDSLSNESLEENLAKKEEESLRRALEWSKRVNEGINTELEGKDKPFVGAKEGLEAASKEANVVIVSSANRGAVESEWTRHGFIEYTDDIYTQERGSKADAIEDVKSKGFATDHIIMVGDAPGDLKSAEKTGVYFYPILFGKEKESWELFVNEALAKFLAGDYDDYDKQMKERFNQHLNQNV